MAEHYVAFWNVENLFDLEDSPDRPGYLQEQLASELVGWNEAVLSRKIEQLASLVFQMNGGRGPDLLGICEIENENVVRRLIAALEPLGRNYDVAHADTKDGRGIDCALVFDAGLYQKAETFSHFVLKRTATRDIFQVNLTTQAGRDLIAVVNHWPSRSGGEAQSAPYRMMVGETLAYFHKRMLEEKGRDVAVVVMGDFNDEPFDRSVTEYALSIRNAQRLLNATSVDYFLNLMWEVTGQGDATFYFGSQPNMLDQFWVARGIASDDKAFQLRPGSVRVERFAELVRPGDYPGARKFGRPAEAGFDRDGYSDHFPISLILDEADR
jgi:hypothetical protein